MTAQDIQTHDEPTPLGCDPADLAWVESTVKQAGTSFAAGMRILPPMRRYGMYAIYAFCRVVDDIADGYEPMPERKAALDAWHQRIAGLYDHGTTQDPLDRVLLAAIHFFALRQEDFHAIIDGMMMDAENTIVAPDEKTLDLYCDRVASAVGRLSVRIFGDSTEDADKVAYHLGRALQLTNILRDIAEDAARGRLYLPGDLLDRFHVPHDPIKALSAPGLQGVASILSVRALDHFRKAFIAMQACRPKAMFPARIMGASYEGVLIALRKRGWSAAALHDRPKTSALTKVLADPLLPPLILKETDGMAASVHIIGGGVAGLAAAVEVAGSGRRVIVHEAGRACGGRARSYEDKQLGCRIDNGNHLLLSANKTVFRYLAMTGGTDTLTGPGIPIFPFVDLAEGARWTLDLSRGRMPWWVFQPHRRVPDMRVVELRSLQKLMQAGEDEKVADCLLPGALSRRLLEPFAISALNTSCETGSAALLGAVVKESLSLGGKACVPWFPKDGLSETLVDPALAHLAILHAEVRTQSRISALEVSRGRVTGLHSPEGLIPLTEEDTLILAVPAPVAEGLLAPHLPGFQAPNAFESILNLHFRMDTTPRALGSFARAGFMGLVGSIAEWVFLRGDILSVTVSAANRFAEQDPDDLARTIWHDVRRACDPVLKEPLPATPPHQRVVWEKRATFAATLEQNRLRPGPATPLINLALAGGLDGNRTPATLEGAMRSGVKAMHTLGLRRS